MNTTGISEDCPYSYFFSTTGSIWGWASWKRVIDTWDENYSFLDDEFTLRQFYNACNDKLDVKKFLQTCRNHRASGRAHYESIGASSFFLNSRLNIVPKKNMISNIGISENSTHSVLDLKMVPRGIRRIFYMQTYEIEFPLKHPEYIIEDVVFRKKLYRIMAVGHPFIKMFRRCESRLLRIRYGDFKNLWQAFLKKYMEKRAKDC
jgi:hypothetical protein